jgi:hypothetical protein
MKMKFYDLKAKKSFSTDKFTTKTKKGRKFAVAKTPSGSTAWRAMKK